GVPPMNFIELDVKNPQQEIAAKYLERRIEGNSPAGSVGIRPESFEIFTENAHVPEQALSLPGEIESVMPTGGSWTIQTRVGDQSVYSTVLNRGDLDQGQRVELAVTADKLHVFDHEEQRMTVNS